MIESNKIKIKNISNNIILINDLGIELENGEEIYLDLEEVISSSDLIELIKNNKIQINDLTDHEEAINSILIQSKREDVFNDFFKYRLLKDTEIIITYFSQYLIYGKKLILDEGSKLVLRDGAQIIFL